MFRSIQVQRSPIHGNGVFAARDLPVGHRVIQYRGKVVTHDEADALYDGSVESGHTFLFTLNEQYIVDANQRGNDARWINHSCEPNCEAVIVEDKGGDGAKDRIYIETIRVVRAGEELTYDYGIKLDCRQTARLKRIWACRCGKAACTGTMLKTKPAKKAKPKSAKAAGKTVKPAGPSSRRTDKAGAKKLSARQPRRAGQKTPPPGKRRSR